MPSMCTQLAARTERLAQAQRAFWDAWKAVSSGDHARLKEAYEAKRALEDAHREILQITYSSWAPRVRTHVTLPEAYHLVTFEEEQYVDELGDYFTHFRESTHEHGSGVTTVRWMPDGSLLSAGYDRTIKISHPDKPKKGTMTLQTGMYSPTGILLLPDGRIAMTDDNSTLAIWTKDFGGHYTREDFMHLQGRQMMDMLSLPDETWFIATDDFILVSMVGQDGHRTSSRMEGYRGRAGALHPLPDGRVVSGWQDGEVLVWRREGDTYVIDRRLSSPKGYRGYVNKIHANADGRIIVMDYEGGCEVWRTTEEGKIVYERTIDSDDGLSDGMVLPDGSIALLSSDQLTVYAKGNEVDGRVLIRTNGDQFDIREDGCIAVADDNQVKVFAVGKHSELELEDEGI